MPQFGESGWTKVIENDTNRNLDFTFLCGLSCAVLVQCTSLSDAEIDGQTDAVLVVLQ